ncbi:hypothetical protein CPB84DRAFT_610012 [Gymnopilus junonius]|uniref:Uncharacterized protein n=1 Tax=Gymnopilus junonius TaxID=109634 RepID=A0A9P5NTT7_GYMJU|nr:hypothetical protein CPB84DRAFT_610012 [Gymnopilus junonius]
MQGRTREGMPISDITGVKRVCLFTWHGGRWLSILWEYLTNLLVIETLMMFDRAQLNGIRSDYPPPNLYRKLSPQAVQVLQELRHLVFHDRDVMQRHDYMCIVLFILPSWNSLESLGNVYRYFHDFDEYLTRHSNVLSLKSVLLNIKFLSQVGGSESKEVLKSRCQALMTSDVLSSLVVL